MNNRQIYIKYQKQVVHVRINKTLIELLRHGIRHKGNILYLPSYMMSTRIHRIYRENFHEELNISVHSLALEILIHTAAYMFCDYFSCLLQKMGLSSGNRLVHLLDYIRDHSEVIDCGERIQDNNRFVFDWLSYIRILVYPAFRLCLFIFPLPKPKDH